MLMGYVLSLLSIATVVEQKATWLEGCHCHQHHLDNGGMSTLRGAMPTPRGRPHASNTPCHSTGLP